MKKHVVFSYNSVNPDYSYFAPLTAWAWKKFGWYPVCIAVGDQDTLTDKLIRQNSHHTQWIYCNEIAGYRSATVAQISRLYAARYISGLIMTADVDMIPLSNYWSQSNDMTVFGYDLTDHTEFPICYLSMLDEAWTKVMQLDLNRIDQLIRRDLDSMPNAKSDDFYKFWGVDQQLITQRLTPFNPVQIKRGREANGLACGRVDRASWTLSLSTLIDAHLPQQVYHKGREKYFDDMMGLLHHVWPEEDWGWFYTYTVEFRKLTGHA